MPAPMLITDPALPPQIISNKLKENEVCWSSSTDSCTCIPVLEGAAQHVIGMPLDGTSLHMVHTSRHGTMQVKFVSPQELNWAKQAGTPIIDVRPEKEFLKGHIPGSVNVQYYRWIEGADGLVFILTSCSHDKNA